MKSRGISEVVGELLLLVIVVLLVTAFASYSSSFIPPLKNTPQTGIVGYTNSSNYTMVIQYGEPIPLSGLSIVVTYNYSSKPQTLNFRYSYTNGNVAVFTSGSEKAWLILRPGYYNRSWSFGEKLNLPRKGNCTVIKVVYMDNVVSKLYFPEG
jgi:flagellin-like protein